MADEKSIINAPVLESELDTILGAKGIIVKSENIKAIGVPAHNLVPDENGVVALEKQDAFLKPETSQLSSPTVQETPLVAATSINPEMPVSDTIPAEQPIAQVDSAPVPQQTEPTINNPISNIDTNLTNSINTSELESKEVLNNDLQVPAMEAAAEIMNAQTESNGEIEEVLYNRPGDILTGPAVDVSNQDVLGSIRRIFKRERKTS